MACPKHDAQDAFIGAQGNGPVQRRDGIVCHAGFQIDLALQFQEIGIVWLEFQQLIHLLYGLVAVAKAEGDDGLCVEAQAYRLPL